MKKVLLILLILLPGYLLISFYFLDKDYFLPPVEHKGDIFIRCDSRGDGFFGSQRNGNRMHEGIDLFAEIGSPVRAVRSGRVVSAGENHGMGKYVIIRHPGNIVTTYGHLSRIYVVENDYVRQGEVVGGAGKTGNAKYSDIHPHLHFEVRKNGIPQDPLEYLE